MYIVEGLHALEKQNKCETPKLFDTHFLERPILYPL